MSEDDKSYLTLAALIALLAVGCILQSKVLKNHAETLIRHDEDITFLRLVARELEKKVVTE